MNEFSTVLSDHASRRSKTRCVSLPALELVLDWGQTWRQPAGRTLSFVGKRALKRAAASGVDATQARNLGAVVAGDGTVVTVIRSSDLRRMKRQGRRSTARRAA